MSLINGYIFRLVARYGLAADVPALTVGELGYDVDTHTFRVGDGTAVPPRFMSTKSTGDWDFSDTSSIKLSGGLVATGGKIGGINPALLNQSNGFLVRTGDNQFSNATLISGDNTITITNGNGLGGSVDLRVNTAVLFPLISVPSDILEYPALANFPAIGQAAKIYVATTTNLIYRWNGTTYVELSATGGGGGLAIVEYANLAAFPVTGATNTLYVALNTQFTYRWSGSVYVLIGDGVSAGATASVLDFANLAGFPGTGANNTLYIARDTNFAYRWNAGTSAYVLMMAGTNTVATAAIIDAAVTNAKLANMAAYTYKMNNTASSAAPTDVNPVNFPAQATPALTRFMLTHDAVSGAAAKTTLAEFNWLTLSKLTDTGVGALRILFFADISALSIDSVTVGQTKTHTEWASYGVGLSSGNWRYQVYMGRYFHNQIASSVPDPIYVTFNLHVALFERIS